MDLRVMVCVALAGCGNGTSGEAQKPGKPSNQPSVTEACATYIEVLEGSREGLPAAYFPADEAIEIGRDLPPPPDDTWNKLPKSYSKHRWSRAFSS